VIISVCIINSCFHIFFFCIFIFVYNCRCDDFENPKILCTNVSLPVDDTENDYDEDCETPPELLRLVEQETKEIRPHQEEIKIMNLGEEGEEKQVKIGTTMTEEMQKQLLTLLREFRNVFT